MENSSEIRFRCSSLGFLMVNDRSGKQMGEGAKTHLIDCFISAKYKRREEIFSKFLDKGNDREEDSITLLSRVTKKFYKKNDVRLTNDFITGELDIYLGESIENADESIDTKTSWSAHTFFRAQKNEIEPKYYWQGMGYMWLTGAKKHTIAYCLVNSTEKIITDEKRKASYQCSIDFENDPKYIERCKQIEINHIFDIEAFKKEYPYFDFHNDISLWKWDIPMKGRIFTQTFERKEGDIEKLKNRIIEAKEWMHKELFKI